MEHTSTRNREQYIGVNKAAFSPGTRTENTLPEGGEEGPSFCAYWTCLY